MKPSALGPRRRPAVLLVALALTSGLFATSFGSALAHANLVRSNPPSSAALAHSPAQVQLWFSETLEPSFSTAVVYDANRQRVDQGDSHVALDDPLSLVISLTPNLPKGTYVVAWVTQSKVDGHVVRGTVPFGVGVGVSSADVAAQGPAQGPVSGGPVEMVLRWLILLSAAALVGSFGFWIAQDGALRSLGPGSRALVWQARLASGALLTFGLANVALIDIQTTVSANVSPFAALGTPLARELTGTQYGGVWIIRMILVAFLAIVLWAHRPGGSAAKLGSGHWNGTNPGEGQAKHESPGPFPGLSKVKLPYRPASATLLWNCLGLVDGGALLATITLTSHSAAATTTTRLGALPVGIALDWLHLLLASIWLGGLLQLGILLTDLGKLAQPVGRARVLAGLVRRFSTLAGVALVVTGATGLGEALIHVGTLANLLGSGYGQALLAKTLLLAPVLALAAVNHWFFRPGLARIAGSTIPAVVRQTFELLGSLRWTVQAESLCLVGVLGAVGVMTSLSPAQQLSAAATGGPLALTAPADDLTVSLSLSPGTPGPNRYDVSVRGADGRPAAGVARVTTRLTFLDSDLGVAEAILQPGNDGRWTGQGQELAVAGRWLAEVLVRRPGRDDARATFGFSIATTGAAALTDASAIHNATAQSIANGATIYQQNCASCHGLDARGNGPRAPTLNPRPSDLILHVPLHPDADLLNWIATGFPGSAMPAFQDTLTAEERQNVLDYLKSIAGAAANASPPPTAAPSSSPSATDGSLVVASSLVPTAVVAEATQTEAPIAPLVAAATPTRLATQPSAPTPVSGGDLQQRQTIGDLAIGVQITPHIYQPAEVTIDVQTLTGQPAGNVNGVDLQVAMEGMDHGARGISASSLGNGRYRANAMLLAMEGAWRLAVRVNRTDGSAVSAVFSFDVPRENPTGVVSAMYTRPDGPVQIEDVAVYPGEITPDAITVQAGRPVQVKFMLVDQPSCSSTIQLAGSNLSAPVAPDGLGELDFVPQRSETLHVTCSGGGLTLAP